MMGDRQQVAGNFEPEEPGISITRAHARVLVDAGDVLSDLWGDVAEGKTITLVDLNDRLKQAGLAYDDVEDHVTLLSPELCEAVIDVDVALGRADGDDKHGDDIETLTLDDDGDDEDDGVDDRLADHERVALFCDDVETAEEALSACSAAAGPS